MIDLSRIEKYIFRENWLLLLGFPTTNQRGYVPLRVTGREFFEFMYDPIQEGQISANIPADTGIGTAANNGISDLGFQVPLRPGSSFLTGKPYNVLLVNDATHLYQAFYGISPSHLRVFLEAPASTGQRNLDIDRWGSNKAEFGYIDGLMSPLLKPSPDAELIIPPQFDVAFGYGNPGAQTINPLLQFYMNRCQVQVVTDAGLIDRMLKGQVPVAIKTIGGLSTFTYSVPQYYGIEPIPLGASIQEINQALSGATAQNTAPPNPTSVGLARQRALNAGRQP